MKRTRSSSKLPTSLIFRGSLLFFYFSWCYFPKQLGANYHADSVNPLVGWEALLVGDMPRLNHQNETSNHLTPLLEKKKINQKKVDKKTAHISSRSWQKKAGLPHLFTKRVKQKYQVRHPPMQVVQKLEEENFLYDFHLVQAYP